MPVLPVYPGAYVEAQPGSVRTVTGMPVPVAAFIGAARSSPLNKATEIHSYADFEGIFGRLWDQTTMGYAVKDFYGNGGRRAVIVRIAHDDQQTTTQSDIDADIVNILVGFAPTRPAEFVIISIRQSTGSHTL